MHNEGSLGEIDNELARKYLKLGVDAESPTAMIEYGVLLQLGLGGERDQREGDRLIERAASKVSQLMESAKQGNGFDQMSFGLYGSTEYLNGKNDELLEYWTDEAAAINHPSRNIHQAIQKASSDTI